MGRFSAVDIGTNSVRLLVADVSGARGGSAGEPADRAVTLQPVDRRMRITRLGEGVNANRALSPDAITRTVAVLRDYREVLDSLGSPPVRATATSAARDADNRDEFFDAATDALGTRPELLAGEEEAELSFLGATAEIVSGTPAPYLVFDIGGGSTEFVVGTEKPAGLISIDVGCVRLTESYLHGDPPTPVELSNALAVVRGHLADVVRDVPGVENARTVVGLAGTVTTIAAVEMGLAVYSRERIHHFHLTHEAAEDVFRTLATEPAQRRRHNPGLEAERVDVIVGGALVLVAIFRTLGIPEILVSEADILDGLVRRLATTPR